MEEDLSCYKCPLRHLQRIIMKAHRLVDLGTGPSSTIQSLRLTKNLRMPCPSFLTKLYRTFCRYGLYRHKGLGLVAAMCEELEDLRVFPSDPFGAGNATVTEGLWLINPSNGNMPDDLILLSPHATEEAWKMTTAEARRRLQFWLIPSSLAMASSCFRARKQSELMIITVLGPAYEVVLVHGKSEASLFIGCYRGEE
ncbi:hypothetical protein Nepgr_003387 [Nepenthes gracilis]|uniref:Uncharacterized protein n=1 Tax=Nepenthes gracilis TaxID=150966 RepID=A0AAD3RZG3_NEPGR|nr:hypothetical protein Nepgr_003387 [Nepenthes gracilis]